MRLSYPLHISGDCGMDINAYDNISSLIIREPKIVIELRFWSRTGFLAEKAATKQGEGALLPVPSSFWPCLCLLPLH